jgi:hypothetical protein
MRYTGPLAGSFHESRAEQYNAHLFALTHAPLHYQGHLYFIFIVT